MKIANDRIKHLLACSLVSFAASSIESACGAEYHNAWLAGCLAGIAIGVGKEYGDRCAPNNKWDWLDIGADAIGSVVGTTLGSMLSLFNH